MLKGIAEFNAPAAQGSFAPVEAGSCQSRPIPRSSQDCADCPGGDPGIEWRVGKRRYMGSV
jgi:hypothetical protein